MRTKTIRIWTGIHKWTSLICTAFLLMLCITGLPLIFSHEIDHTFGNHIEPPEMAANTPRASLDRVVENGLKKRQGDVIQFMFWDPDEPDLVYLAMNKSVTTPADSNKFVVLDARTAQVLGEPRYDQGFMHIMLRLHVDMFAGLPGMLFLGAMGLLFVVAIVSGIVLYAPFMRRLDFGTVRKDKSRRTKWLDLHNMLGVITLAWALVVGTTGIINTWADLIFKAWQNTQLVEMTSAYKDMPAPASFASFQAAMDTVGKAAPDMKPSFVAFPGTPFSSKHHYAVFMRGDTALTSKLLKPFLVDGENATLTDTRTLPWWVSTLLISKPLHFGDYGGMPLKIIWALLDLVTIVVLSSGLYLWLARRRISSNARAMTRTPRSLSGQPAE